MKLEPHTTLPTSGARCVCLFTINNEIYVALPQLAEDIDGAVANMNGGNSETHASIYQWKNDDFRLFQTLSVHGGEHIDFAIINNIPMLAIANIRGGSQPNYSTDVSSEIFSFQDNFFSLKQSIPSFAAKSTCFFSIADQHFLGISEGVLESEADKGKTSSNNIYKWDTDQFHHYQALPSTWGYDMSHFEFGGNHYLSVADNINSSKIYIWQEGKFEQLQEFANKGGGRGFCYFQIGGHHYIAFANLLHQSFLFRWNGNQFEEVQAFDGAGARSFHFVQLNGENYLFRVNFITGTRDAPITKQTSQVYKWQNDKFEVNAEFVTYGGTDCKTFTHNNSHYLVVSNSLAEDTRFRTDSITYKLHL